MQLQSQYKPVRKYCTVCSTWPRSVVTFASGNLDKPTLDYTTFYIFETNLRRRFKYEAADPLIRGREERDREGEARGQCGIRVQYLSTE